MSRSRSQRGEVFCLLGPNGAGKTTTVEILEGYRVRSGGEVSVLGFDPARSERGMRERVGIVLQQCGVQNDLSVAELLEMYGSYHRTRDRSTRCSSWSSSAPSASERAGELSGGQRRRLDLALALIGDPELIFLDEPTTGFDPAARHAAWSTIRSLCELGKTVFLTTHFMDEAQHLADRVAIMRDGEIIALGSPDELGGRDARPGRDPLRAAARRRARPAAADALRALHAGRRTRPGRDPRPGGRAAAADRLGDRPRAAAVPAVGQPADAGGHLPGVDRRRRRPACAGRRRSHEHPGHSRTTARRCAAISASSAGRSATSSAPTGATAAAACSRSRSR